MKELRDLIGAANSLKANNEPFAIASIVRVEGSAFRRPGARMLIRADGSTVGAISGGCLEAEVVARAAEVLKTGMPAIQTFELSEDDYIRGFGTGCGGDIDVLIEKCPVDGHISVLSALENILNHRYRSILATVVKTTTENELLGKRVIVGAGKTMESDLPLPVLSLVGDLFDSDKSYSSPVIVSRKIGEDEIDILIEPMNPPVRLVIVGDGPDIHALVKVSSLMGWRTEIIGQKPLGELKRLFPEADNFHFVMSAGDLADDRLDPRTAVVTMTHNYLRDRDFLRRLIGSEAGYFGALGRGVRTNRMLKELQEQGFKIDQTSLDRLYGPAGLDIGSEAPEEIALAIVAEIQSVLSGRPAGALRERKGPIHTPMAHLKEEG